MPKAYLRPRPIRIAFLVDEHANWKSMLEAIFADCLKRWGGRFNLIVPCERGQIRQAYLPWLAAYDPDIIYSYVDLADVVIERLHERLYPGFLIQHNFYTLAQRDRHAYSPNL